MMSDTPTRDQIARLARIRSFPQLVTYLRDELGWPISQDDFEDVDDLFYEFTPEELGIDARNAAKIESIRRLRPLDTAQPWGIFFVKFEPRRLPVVALRRLLGAVARKKRASANPAERQAWAADDLLFVSNYGEGEERRISFAHFTPGEQATDLPTLKVLGWDGQDTALHLDQVASALHRHLIWPAEAGDLEEWRKRWRSAFRLRHREVITTAKDLSVRLAALARNIRDRIATVLAVESKRGQWRELLEAFQQSLVGDLDEKGFADMYAQTIAYGLLSARIVDPKHRTAEDFAAHMRTSPFLRELMESFITLGGRKRGEGGAGIDFDELGVSEVVELLDEANMEAVVADFGRQKQGEDPVIHFYEHFLTEYDKQEKVSRGVFYTPRPVVSYIVRSVDELLRSEFGLEDGLADSTTWGEMAERHPNLKIPEGTSPDQAFVQILDPATGTGTFLVEVIEIVHATMMDKWRSEGVRSEKGLTERWNQYVPKHLLPRLHGYELMMAPYAIAHLKIGLKLYETGYRFESDERARVYLTNALEPAQDHSGKFEFAIPALAHEAKSVNEVKRKERFTVFVGNPPYNNRSDNRTRWITELIEVYKKTVRQEETQIQGLSDDYVKFLRLAEWNLSLTGAGVLGMITNSGYLDGHIYRDMREHLVRASTGLRIFNLHGDTRKKETAPDGAPDKNVFDIMQGVAVLTLTVGGLHESNPNVSYGAAWGDREKKYRALAESAADNGWGILSSQAPLWMLVPSGHASAEWTAGISLAECFGTGSWQKDKTDAYASGFKSQQDEFAIAFTPEELVSNIETLLEPNMTEAEMRKRFSLCNTNQWNFTRARERLRDSDWRGEIQRVLFRPFDFRYTVVTQDIVTNPRREIMAHLEQPNLGFLGARKATEGFASFVTRVPCGHKIVGNYDMTTVFPLYRYRDSAVGRLEFSGYKELNLSSKFMRQLKGRVPSASEVPDRIVHYIYALFYSPNYRKRFAEVLRNDFPRVLLPGNSEIFGLLAQLGSELVALHVLESPTFDKPMALYEGPTNPEVEKVSYSHETVWLDKAQTCGFKGVSEEVWNFHIGGYQVCDKWLKDRQAKGGKNPRPGRILTDEDIAHYQKIIVAISETIRIMGEIDEVIDQHGGWPDAFATDVGIPEGKH